MQFAGLVKRIIPFLLTFSAGLLLASLFIPIGLPDFGTYREARRGRHCREHRDLRMENDRLREELRVSEMDKEQFRRNVQDSVDTMNVGELPLELEAPHPPPPPRRPKHPRFDNLR
jgi:hypothetical protein